MSAREDQQRRQDAEYTAAMDAWYERLQREDPEQLKNLINQGVFDGYEPRYEVSGRAPHEAQDPAESVHASEAARDSGPNLLGDLVGEIGLTEEQAAKTLAFLAPIVEREAEVIAARQVQLIAGTLLSSRNARLSAAGLAFAAGLAASNGFKSQTAFAEHVGVRRATVSKYAKRWQALLGTHPSVFQKSLRSCQIFAQRQRESHWRRQHFKSFRKAAAPKMRAARKR